MTGADTLCVRCHSTSPQPQRNLFGFSFFTRRVCVCDLTGPNVNITVLYMIAYCAVL